MGEQPTKQRPGEAEAIEIGVSVLKRLPILDSVRPDAEAVIAAAYPVIEAAVRADERQRIAHQLRLLEARVGDYTTEGVRMRIGALADQLSGEETTQ